jgi:isopropylmalate/homocitrate/citramalate synthase
VEAYADAGADVIVIADTLGIGHVHQADTLLRAAMEVRSVCHGTRVTIAAAYYHTR